jgi:hypothetical protein
MLKITRYILQTNQNKRNKVILAAKAPATDPNCQDPKTDPTWHPMVKVVGITK